MVADRHSCAATNSRTQRKEEKAPSLTIRFPSRKSIRPVEIRETPPPQPISSVPSRLAIDTGSQSACPEFADSRRDLPPAANPASRFDLNLSLWRKTRSRSKEQRSLP